MASGKEVLVIVGPGEFWVDEGKIPVNDGELRRSLYAPENLLRAYDRFGAQGIYLSKAAQGWLGSKVSALPSNYVLESEEPAIRFVSISGKKVALIYLPGSKQKKSRALFKLALAAGRRAAEEADLVIGIIPWGSELERDFAEAAQGIYHIILGGGKGYGFAATAAGNSNGVLWARPEELGRSVNTIEILAWPDKSAHVWMQRINFNAELKTLGANIPSDPVIVGIFPEK